MNELKPFGQHLHDLIRSKNMSIQKLADSTAVSHKYIQALIDDNLDELPPRPYIRGYIKSIAHALDTDFNSLWLHYKREHDVVQSGAEDILPSNRFAVEHKKRISLILGGVVLLILAFVIIPQLSDFFGTPSLYVSSPSQETLVVSDNTYSIEGSTGRSSDIISINGTDIPVQEDGSFRMEVPLSEGANTFNISVTRFLGNTTTITRTIFLSSQATSTSPLPSPSPSPSQQTPQPSSSLEDIPTF